MDWQPALHELVYKFVRVCLGRSAIDEQNQSAVLGQELTNGMEPIVRALFGVEGFRAIHGVVLREIGNYGLLCKVDSCRGRNIASTQIHFIEMIC